MSNRDRIARAAEEARLTEAEKAVKKATKAPTGTRAKRVTKPVRVKIVWEVCSANGAMIHSYPYPEKAEAEAQTAALTRSTGHTHILRPTKVPMD